MTIEKNINNGNDAGLIASLCRSLLAVVHGAPSAIVTEGHISLHAPSDEAVRTFAAEAGVEVRTSSTREPFLYVDALVDNYSITVTGPSRKAEQTAEVTP